MLILAAILSSLMGIVLGMLGGGGSILTVPILVFGLGMEPKQAIATSLLVVGITSAFGAAQHARHGNVNFRIGISFALAAMVGAFAGGLLAAYVPAQVLMVGFAGAMAATAIAMLRKKEPVDGEPARKKLSFINISLLAAAVGLLTGLVGAGGGFMVVPALVLFGGLGMRQAIGTSLFVLSLNSLAGMAGHLGHTSIDLSLAAIITVAAVVGSVVGTVTAKRLDPSRLRSIFAWFVLAMAVFMVSKQLPPAAAEALWVHRWPWYVGGAVIGGFVLFFLLVGRQTLGISTAYEDACGALTSPSARKSWRLPFVAGVVLGGAFAAVMGGGLVPTTAMGMFDAVAQVSLPAKAAIFLTGGVLIGFGTRLAGGCTSGHGIVGMSQFAPSSMIATGTFMATGALVTNALWAMLGG